MNFNGGKKCVAKLTAAGAIVLGSLLATAPNAWASIIVNDSWSDGVRSDDPVDPLDAAWWTSTASSAIEVSPGSLGLVSGTSGRGIHGTFTPQSLTNVGDSLTATFTFATPATVGSGFTGAFKVGLFNTLGDPGLKADLSASSGSPNHIYDPMPGYWMDYDVNASPSNIAFREKTFPYSTGQLISSTTGYAALANGGATYSFTPTTSYTGVFSLTKTASGLDLTGSLSQGTTLLSTFTTSDSTVSASTFDLLAFHVNASIFGSSATVGAADNGIDFSNVKIELTSVPEPSAIALEFISLGLVGAFNFVRRSRRAH